MWNSINHMVNTYIYIILYSWGFMDYIGMDINLYRISTLLGLHILKNQLQ